MENKIRDAFGDIHAGDQLKLATRQYVREAVKKRQQRQRHRLPLYAAAACCLLLVLLGGYRLYFTPTSVISIDINPSIELEVNRFDRIIAVNGRNDDGTELADSLELLHLDYSSAVDQVVGSETVSQCLARDEWLTITVVEIDPAQGEEILSYVTACTAGTKNTFCCGVAQEAVSEAHDLGLSYGKYRLYLELRAYTDTLTPEQAGAMTMRELRELLTRLQGENPADMPQGQGHGNGQGQGQGQGNGQGQNQGQGQGQGWQGGRNS